MELWIPLVGVIGTFTVVVIVIVTLAFAAVRRATMRVELQSKLIDKFASGPELVAFLESPAGQQFVDRVQGAPAVATRERVASGVRKAVVLAALGLGFLAIWLADNNEGFVYPGFILLALGLGQIAAAYAAARISERLAPPDRPHVTSTTDSI